MHNVHPLSHMAMILVTKSKRSAWKFLLHKWAIYEVNVFLIFTNPAQNKNFILKICYIVSLFIFWFETTSMVAKLFWATRQTKFSKTV